MAGPWEKYAQPQSDGPWKKYAKDARGGTAQPPSEEALRRAAEADRIAEDEMILSGSGEVGGTVASAVQGLPFVGEWVDEAFDAVSPGRGERLRDIQGAMERQRPGRAIGAQIAGGVVGSIPLAVAGGGAAANWVGGAASRLQQVGRAAAVAAPVGAAEGASAFAGRAEPGERMKQAGVGAAVGGSLGAVLGPLAPIIGDGVANLAKRVRGLDVRTIADEFGLSRKAARVVQGYLKNDDMDAAMRTLARGGDDMLLAEAGPATRQGLDDAMSAGGGALAAGRSRVTQRVQGQADRFVRTLDDVLGPADGGVKAGAKKIAQRTAAQRQAAYDAAYAQPTPMTGKSGAALQDALDRIDPRTLNQAVDEANVMMRDARMTNQNIMATIDDATGEVSFSQPLNVAQLDHIARALGDIVENGTDPLTGKVTPQARRAASQAKALRDALKEGVPGYERALKLGGDKIQETNALVMGRKLLNPSTTVEDVRDAVKGRSIEAKAAMAKGVRENLDAIMGRARATIADLEAGNMDFDTGVNAVGESVAALRNLTTRNNFTKMRYALGSDAKRLYDEIERMGDALVLRAAVARNSATAIRTAGRDAMEATTAPGVLRTAAGEAGAPLDAARPITRAIAGTDRASISEAQQKIYTEVADALTGIKGQDAQRALAAVKSAMAGQPMREADAELIGRLVGVNAASLLYQSGKQSLAPR